MDWVDRWMHSSWRGNLRHYGSVRLATMSLTALPNSHSGSSWDFPLLLSVVSIAAMLSSGHNSQSTLMSYIGQVMPSAAFSMVQGILAETIGGGRAWMSLLFALWTSSSATVGIMDTLNILYGVREDRPWWRARLIAAALAAATGLLLTTALVIVVYGPGLLSLLLPNAAGILLWRLLQWPAAVLLLMGALLCLYRFAPNRKRQKWRTLLSESIVAAVIWFAVSLLFKFYVRHFSNFGVLYGSLGTLITLMFWFYLSGVAILIGGEVNSTMEGARR